MSDQPTLRPSNRLDARRQAGERNATERPDKDAPTGWFTTRTPSIPYPRDMEKNPRPIRYKETDPWAHLGRVGYRRNTYQFRGANKTENNIYHSQHMKKTAWLEEMRRRIIAERCGISADIDTSDISGTADAYYINHARQKRGNKYYNGPVPTDLR